MGNEIKRCLIITGAPEENIEYYNKYINDRFIIGADSGCEKCKRLGIVPDLIIGDFDSSDKPDIGVETIVLPVKKDDTDTFYAIREAVKRGAEDIIILGGIGSRLDHTYANILSLNYCAENSVKAVMINKNNRVRVLKEGITIKKGDYKYFSLFAPFGSCTGLRIKGAEYGLENYDLKPGCQLTQSNAFTDDALQIEFRSGKILLIESND